MIAKGLLLERIGAITDRLAHQAGAAMASAIESGKPELAHDVIYQLSTDASYELYDIAVESQRLAGQGNKGKTSEKKAETSRENGRLGGAPARFINLDLVDMKKMMHLSERERQVLTMRQSQSLEEVGERLGISRQRVQQLQKQALEKTIPDDWTTDFIES